MNSLKLFYPLSKSENDEETTDFNYSQPIIKTSHNHSTLRKINL